MSTLGRSGNVRHGNVLPYFHQHVEEDAQVFLRHAEDSLLGLAEIPDQAEVDSSELLALADGVARLVLSEGLTGFMMYGQPVT